MTKENLLDPALVKVHAYDDLPPLRSVFSEHFTDDYYLLVEPGFLNF